MTFLANAQNTAESSLFQCQPTTDHSGRVFTPNIPDSYFNDAIARSSSIGDEPNLIRRTEQRGTTFIYTTPPEPLCSGTVLAFEFCYQTRIDQISYTATDRESFRFLHLSRNGYRFTVNDLITVTTSPQWNYCTHFWWNRWICCDTTTVNDQFHIPASNYTFGVVIINDIIRPLTFSSKYQFPHFQARPSGNNNGPVMGDEFILEPGDLKNESSLLLLRLLIGMCIRVEDNLYTGILRGAGGKIIIWITTVSSLFYSLLIMLDVVFQFFFLKRTPSLSLESRTYHNYGICNALFTGSNLL